MRETAANTKIAAALVVWLAMSVVAADAATGPAADPVAAGSTWSTTVPALTSATTTTTRPATTTTTQPDTTSTTISSTSATTAAPQATTTTTSPPISSVTYASVEGIDLIRDFTGYTDRGRARWEASIEGIQDITVTSTADGAEQPVLWLPPQGEGDRPLLVILHSWSSTYMQHAGIPFAMWAQENGWAVIAPEFRGRNDNRNAIGSELAVQDVVDAIDFATARDGVDATRVFVVGYSGGGMMGLLMAGRHPDKVTAVSAWGAVYDLIAFYQQSRNAGRHYWWEIQTACGGDPRWGGDAEQECLRRSPMTYLHEAWEAGVPVYLGHGLGDTILSPAQSALSFNRLAEPRDRLTLQQIETLGRRRVPMDLAGDPGVETFFGPDDPEVVLAVESTDVRLVYFQSNHEMVYQAAMRWFATDPGR